MRGPGAFAPRAPTAVAVATPAKIWYPLIAPIRNQSEIIRHWSTGIGYRTYIGTDSHTSTTSQVSSKDIKLSVFISKMIFFIRLVIIKKENPKKIIIRNHEINQTNLRQKIPIKMFFFLVANSNASCKPYHGNQLRFIKNLFKLVVGS